MTECKLKELFNSNTDSEEDIVDIVAVGGIQDTDDGKWFGFENKGENSLPPFLSSVDLNIRISTFSYRPEDVFVRPGIQDVASRLLQSLVELRKGHTKPRSILFICHDIGGVLVKEALSFALFLPREFRSITVSTCCIIFLACPHRCRSLGRLAKSIQRLFKSTTDTKALHVSWNLATKLAALALDVNHSFIESAFWLRITMMNITSTNDDANIKIFNKFETSMSFHSIESKSRYAQIMTDEAHSSLVAEHSDDVDKFISRALQVASPELEANLNASLRILASAAYAQMAKISLSSYSSVQKTATQKSLLQVLDKWEQTKGQQPHLAIHDTAGTARETAMSVVRHLGHHGSPKPLVQFFEFRHGQERWNTLESMLCTFIASQSLRRGSTEPLAELYEDAKTYQSWSLDRLLTVFWDCLAKRCVDKPNHQVVWLLIDFDERVESHNWLLSHLFRLLNNSELKLMLLLINNRPLQPEVFSDHFQTASVPGCSHESEISGTMEVDKGLTLAMDSTVLDLIVEFPMFYRERRLISQLIQDCRNDKYLRSLLLKLLRLSAKRIPAADLGQRLLELMPIAFNSIFRTLWLPPWISSQLRKQIQLATELLIYSYRPLTLAELSDFEQRTSYSQQMGWDQQNNIPTNNSSPRTISLIGDIADVQHGEVLFLDTRVRELLYSEMKPAEGDVHKAHRRLATWCLERIANSTDDDWKLYNSFHDDIIINEWQESFFAYAIKYWVYHVTKSGPNIEEVMPAIQNIFESKNHQRWVRAFWAMSNSATRGGLSKMTALAIFAEHRSESLVVAYISQFCHEPSIEQTEQVVFEALKSVARAGDLSIFNKLIKFPLPLGQYLDDVLLCAFPSKDQRITRHLIDMAITDPELLHSPSTLLGWAAFYGLEEVVRVMILLVTAEKQKENGYTIMQLALKGSAIQVNNSEDIIKQLSEAEYPLGTVLENGHVFCALETASLAGNPNVTRFIAEALFPPGDPSDSSEDRIWPKRFLFAVKAAILHRNHSSLDILLSIAFAKDWFDVDSITTVLSAVKYPQTSECCKHLGTFLISITKDSTTRQDTAATLLADAIKKGLLDYIPFLLALPNPIKSDELEDLLAAVAKHHHMTNDLFLMLLEEGWKDCDADSTQEIWKVALRLAFSKKHPKLIQLIMDKEPSANINTPLRSQRTPLYYAAFYGLQSTLRTLIEAGAAVDAHDEDGWTPLHAAYDRPKVLEILIKSGADIDAKDHEDQTPLYLAIKNGYKDSVKLLLDRGASLIALVGDDDDDDKMTELGIAAYNDEEDIFCMLLNYGASPFAEALNDKGDREMPCQRLLHYCVSRGFIEGLKMLLLYDIDVHIREPGLDGTVLDFITSATKVETLKLIINRGAEINASNKRGATPLFRSIWIRNLDVTRYLIQKGANINYHIPAFSSAIHLACTLRDIHLVKYMAENGANIYYNDPSSQGTPLHVALVRPDNDSEKREIINYLLLEIKDFNLDEMSLHWGSYLAAAALCAELEVVETLLARKANVNAIDSMGRQPIHFALCRNLSRVRLILEAGADLYTVDAMKRNALQFAVTSGDIRLVKYIIQLNKDFIHQVDADGWTTLMWSVRPTSKWKVRKAQRKAIVVELLAQGANKTAQGEAAAGNSKWTALQVAQYYGHDDLLPLLTPTEQELQFLSDDDSKLWTETPNQKPNKGQKKEFGLCNACLLAIYSKDDYTCQTCFGFCLCFKCYKSRAIIHPRHSFIAISETEWYESSEDEDDTDSNDDDTDDNDDGDTDDNDDGDEDKDKDETEDEDDDDS